MIRTVRREVEVAVGGEERVALYMKQERDQIRGLTAEEIQSWSDLPPNAANDSLACLDGQQGMSVRMYSLTPLALELGAELLGRDMCKLLARDLAAIVATCVVDHQRKL